MSLIPKTLEKLTVDFEAISELSRTGSISSADLVSLISRPIIAPVVITPVVETTVSHVEWESPKVPSDSSVPRRSELSAGTPPGGFDAAAEASAAREVLTLRDSIQQLSDTNDRVMAQNIALLADLESAQKAVRELRADKDALALQLKRALMQQ
jgi:hypothetical protein